MKEETIKKIGLILVITCLILVFSNYVIPYIQKQGYRQAQEYYATEEKVPIYWKIENSTEMVIVDVSYAEFNYIINSIS